MELRIWDLPEREVIVGLNKSFKKVLERKICCYGFYKMGKSGFNYTNLYEFLRYNRIPLHILKKIISVLRVPKDYVEKQIIYYRSSHGELEIREPLLPIKVVPELYELIGHLLGDGFFIIKPTRTSTYTNTNRELVNNFIGLLNKCFGKVDASLYLDKRFNAITVNLPKIISIILSMLFPELLEKKVTKSLLSGTNSTNSIRFVRALFDDESHVTTSAIILTQKNKSMLEIIRKLILKFGFIKPEYLSISKKKNLHILTVKGKGLIEYYKTIGFVHPEKLAQLKREIKRKLNAHKRRMRGETKRQIIEILSQTPMTVSQLSANLNIEPQMIRIHMKQLLSSEKIGIVGH